MYGLGGGCDWTGKCEIGDGGVAWRLCCVNKEEREVAILLTFGGSPVKCFN